VIHGDDDQVVPFEVGGKASAALVDGAVLTVYEGGPHGITDTHKDRLNADLLEFLTS
jgi:non-heme chloroperoxidase